MKFEYNTWYSTKEYLPKLRRVVICHFADSYDWAFKGGIVRMYDKEKCVDGGFEYVPIIPHNIDYWMYPSFPWKTQTNNNEEQNNG